MSKYDKKILKKKEIIIFNKSDLIDMNDIKNKLDNFKKRVKKDFEIISLMSNQNLKSEKNYL